MIKLVDWKGKQLTAPIQLIVNMATIAVTWHNQNEYSTQPQKKQQIENDVRESAEAASARRNGATKAVIKWVELVLLAILDSEADLIKGWHPSEQASWWPASPCHSWIQKGWQ